MKYLKTFNESIRDKMTGKSREDIKKSLTDLYPNKKYALLKKHKMEDLYGKEEMEELEKEVRRNYNIDMEYVDKKMRALAKDYNSEPQSYINEEDDDFEVSFRCKNNLVVYMRIQTISNEFEVGYTFYEKCDWDFVESVEDGIYKINNWIDEMGSTNESIRSKMIGKSKEELKKAIDKLPIDELVDKIIFSEISGDYDYRSLYSEKEIEDSLNELPDDEKLSYALRLGLSKFIEKEIKESSEDGLTIPRSIVHILPHLSKAVWNNSYSNVFKSLIKKGADVDLPSWNQILQEAAFSNDIELVELILEKRTPKLILKGWKWTLYAFKPEMRKILQDYNRFVKENKN